MMPTDWLLDTFPPDAPINAFLEHLRKRKSCSVFSPDHQVLNTLFFSQRPKAKGFIFPLAWSILRAIPRGKEARPLDILFVDNCRRHADLMQTVARELAGSYSVGWFTHPVKRRKQAGQVPELTFLDPLYDLVPGGGSGAESAEEKAALDLWRKTAEGGKVPWFTRSILSMNRQLCARATALLQRRRIRAVVLGSDGEQMGSAIGYAAGAMGLPVFVLQHGTHNLHNYFGVSSHLLCWSEMGKEHVEKALPAFGVERIPRFQVDVVGGIHRREDLPAPESPTVLFLDQVSRYGDQIWGRRWIEESRRWLSFLGQKLAGHARLVIRTHPGYEPSPSQMPEGWELSSGLALKQDIQRASVVLAMNSTAGLEAGAMGRPTFFFRDSNMVWLGSLAPLDDLVVSSKEEAVEKIEATLRSASHWAIAAEQSRSQCREYLGSPDHTADRLVACLRAGVEN